MPRSATTRYVIGRYGTGTLWCERNYAGLFILFGDMKIARRGRHGTAKAGTWVSLVPGWKVTSPFGSAELRVQLNESEGVIVSLHGMGGENGGP
jgi:hypothetical protein